MIERVWSINGIILTGQRQSTQIKTCLCTTLTTTNPKQRGVGSNPGLCMEHMLNAMSICQRELLQTCIKAKRIFIFTLAQL